MSSSSSSSSAEKRRLKRKQLIDNANNNKILLLLFSACIIGVAAIMYVYPDWFSFLAGKKNGDNDDDDNEGGGVIIDKGITLHFQGRVDFKQDSIGMLYYAKATANRTTRAASLIIYDSDSKIVFELAKATFKNLPLVPFIGPAMKADFSDNISITLRKNMVEKDVIELNIPNIPTSTIGIGPEIIDIPMRPIFPDAGLWSDVPPGKLDFEATLAMSIKEDHSFYLYQYLSQDKVYGVFEVPGPFTISNLYTYTLEYDAKNAKIIYFINDQMHGIMTFKPSTNNTW